MIRRIALSALLLATAILAGCASGPKFSEISSSIAPIPANAGRIYFFRSSSMFGAAIQPDIRLDGQVVGASKPGGFFYVDRPAGDHLAAASTEVENTASFTLQAGETKYLRTSPSMGLLVGHITIEIEDPQKAKAEIETLSLTGSVGGGAVMTSSSTTTTTTTRKTTPSTSPVPEPQTDASGRPATTRHLDAAALDGHTWTFPHPRDPARYHDVQIRFANGIATANNARSGSSGPYTVEDDKVCIQYAAEAWGHACYWVYDGASTAGGVPTPMLRTVSSHHSVPLTIN